MSDQDAISTETLASDSEREQTRALLEEACGDGRLTLEEFSLRVEAALLARTRGQLQEVTRDLPAAPAPTMTRRAPVYSTLAIMGKSERKGRWRVGEECKTLTVMGECKLDLRDATISGHVTTIEARVIMGTLEVIVPQGVDVEVEIATIMGSKTLKLTGPPPAHGAPTIRVSGFVLAGSVTVRDRPKLGAQFRETMRGIVDEQRREEC